MGHHMIAGSLETVNSRATALTLRASETDVLDDVTMQKQDDRVHVAALQCEVLKLCVSSRECDRSRRSLPSSSLGDEK